METALVATQPTQVITFTAANIKAQVQLIQQVMKSVMKEGTHYGRIPGVDKKMLFKPGAEVLCATFRIAPSYQIDDLSDGDSVRYRVKCIATHQSTGAILGEGMGEGSSNEEKYRWRAAVCDEEFDEAPEDRRRLKWKKGGGQGAYKIAQIRVVPADIANTVLKMACKRAQVAMALNVTAASDIFGQDLEDMPEELRDSVVQQGERAPQTQKPQTQAPRSTNGNTGGSGRATDKQVKLIFVRMDAAGIPENELLARYGVQHINEIPFAKVDDALAWIAQANAA